MADEKKYSAQEAAIAVLAKAEELLKNSELAKSGILKKGYEGFEAVKESAKRSGAKDPAAVAAAVGREKYGKEAFQHAAAEGKKMKKAEEKTENKEKPSNSMKPRIEEKPTERDYNDFETKPGKSSSDDHREEEQKNPLTNPAEQKEGNNPEPGTVPGHYKLAAFCGHMHHKRKMKKGIALG